MIKLLLWFQIYLSCDKTFTIIFVSILFRKVNSYVEIEVNSTAPLKYISYEVLGRGNILVAESIYVQDQHTTSFK